MKLKTFIELSNKFFTDYFKSIFKGVITKQITLQDEGNLLFPNIALYTETDDHFILELFGATKGFTNLNTKKHKEKSTQRYLYQFDTESHHKGNGVLNFNGDNIEIRDFLVSTPYDVKELDRRFKFHNRWSTKFIKESSENGALISFGDDFGSAFIENCVLVNRFNEFYRVKQITSMIIVDKSKSAHKYKRLLNSKLKWPVNSTNELYGVRYKQGEKLEKELISSQFINTFLVPGLRETTIGDFLNENPSFLKTALTCEGFLYEKEFEWKKGNPDPSEKFINPDFMVKRSDGFYDICDLKTPKLDKEKLTTRTHKRRGFVTYIDEGTSQLANYKEYFEFDLNKEYAQQIYDVRVKEPSLYLIVGNYENLDAEELREASRKLSKDFKIIDFDTLNSLFLNKRFNE
ncbi:Shedu anti-phage system protein SduA domain-containing protein [Halobacillus amylolyticus]|uniref:DUF4263 domain-containing protein n=1 Tax=Halobacillus amylolyticus TaxID=2932259 RepID=A0ABY4H7H8_9BACI|nr:Shedu anti-phage system protein SduA domain-containing protein [Halobacillus amylolyticus]UOR10637.1 DUF4263 domain-containing protein [Halobacillus amylolyticus]